MRLFKALSAMVLGVCVLIFAVLFLMPTERIAQIAAQQFQNATGRSLEFGGEVRPSFYPLLGATASRVQIANPQWVGAGAMLQAEEMEIGLDLMALLRGDIQIERVVLQSPQFHVVRDAEGRLNWDGLVNAPGQDAASERRAARDVWLTEARLENASVIYQDAVSNTEHRLDGVEAVLRLPERSGAATLDAQGRLNGQSFQVSMRAENASDLIAGAPGPVALDATVAGASVAFAGLLALDGPILDGRLDTQIPSLQPLFQMAGQDGGALTAQVLPLSFAGQVTLSSDGRLAAREARFRAGGLRLDGALDMVAGAERPRLSGQLSGDVLDLRSAAPQARGGQGQPGLGWSRALIDASALALVDADLSLAVNGLRTDIATLGRTRLDLSIDRARAVFGFREAAVFGGQLTGEFVMNNRSGLSVGGNLQLRGTDLLPLLTELADYRRLQGAGDFDLQFLGVGNDLHTIMNSLRGEGRIALSQGEIIGFDLAGMLRNLDMSYMGEGNRTVYQSVTGSFAISEGILRNEDLRLEASRFSVTGRGQVGIGSRTLDYRIVPSALHGEETLRVPLMITGPWSEPRFRLDLEALAREQMRVEQERLEDIAREEARRLEERARSQIDQRLERELGVERQPGERIEDTLRRGLEQELGNRLRGLLGGD